MKKIVSIIAILIAVIMLLFVYFIDINRIDYATTVDNYYTYDIEKGNLLFKNSDNTFAVNDFKVTSLNAPLFSYNSNLVLFPTSGNVMYIDETGEAVAYQYAPELYVNEIQENIYQIVDSESENTMLPGSKDYYVNISKESLGKADVFLQVTQNSVFLIYGSELTLDGHSSTKIKIPELSYVVIEDNKIIITYMEKGNLVVEDYYYTNDFELSYGDLLFTKQTIVSTPSNTTFDTKSLVENVATTEDLSELIEDEKIIDEGTIKKNGESISSRALVDETASNNTGEASNSNGSNTPGSGGSTSNETTGTPGGGQGSSTDGNGDRKEKPVVEPIPPVVTNAYIKSKEINPYESIQLSITIDNPDEYSIVNIVTSEGTFVVNSVIDGELIIELPAKEAGEYEIYLESMTVSKSKVESIPINQTLTYTVIDTPSISSGTYNNKEKYETHADATISFEAKNSISSNFTLDEITIDEQVYNDIEKTSNSEFIIHDVDVSQYNEAGEYSSTIQSYKFTYNGRQYSSSQVINNEIDGLNYKEIYNQDNVKINTTLSGNTLIYNLEFIDPDKSIMYIEAALYTVEGELVQTVKVNGSSSGKYKISFKDLASGIDYYAEFNVTYSKTDASMSQTKLHSDSENLYIIPFQIPEITSVTYPEIVIEDMKYDLSIEVYNPDQYIFESMVINGTTYDSGEVFAVGESGYRIDDIQLIGHDLTPYLYEYNIESITWIDPLGDETIVTYNEEYAVGRTFMPNVYSDAAGYLYIEFEMFDSVNEYALETTVKVDGAAYTNTYALVGGENVIKSSQAVSKSSIAEVKFTIYSTTGYSIKLSEEDSDYLITNNLDTYVITDTNSYYLDSAGYIKYYGENINGSTDVPSGTFDKIVYQNGTGIALDLQNYSATAWGVNADIIQSELDRYAGDIVDVEMANVSSNENTLVSVTLSTGTYKLIGEDINNRITLAPQTDDAGLVLPAEHGVLVIDGKGNIVIGDSTNTDQQMIFNSIPYEYLSGTTKVVNASYGANGIAINEESGEVFYTAIGADQPIYTPGSSTLYNTFSFYQGIEGSSSGSTSLAYYVEEDGTFGIIANEDVGMPEYISEIPEYITDTEAKIESMDATNNYIGFTYSDGTYNFIGRDDNEQMSINTIQVEPEIVSVEAQSYDGQDLLPTEKFALSINFNNNSNGLYLYDITVKDENGVEKTFTNQKEHDFDKANVDNVSLFSVIGSNEYTVTSATYVNRFNFEESITVSYNPEIPFTIEYVPGIKVSQSYGEDMEIIYGVLDTTKTITLSYAPVGSNEWVDISTLPNMENNALIPYTDDAKEIKFRIQVKSGSSVYESYESEPMIVFDHTNNASSTTSTFTYLDPDTSEIIVKGDSTNPIVTAPKPVVSDGNNFIKIETVNDIGFVMDDAGNIIAFGNSVLSQEFNTLLAPYQGSIIDFQVIGQNGNKDKKPMLNIVLNNGSTELIVPSDYSPQWSIEQFNTNEVFYATGDSDIVYYLLKDGTFGYVGSNTPYGGHTSEPIIPDIENGTIKLQQIEFTEQATYMLTTSNQLFVNRRDMYSTDNVCFYEKNGQTIDSIDSASYDSTSVPYAYEDLYMQNVSIVMDGTLINCSTSGSQEPILDSETYELPTHTFTYDNSTEYVTLIDGVMYQNGEDYYYAGTNVKTRMTINYFIGNTDIIVTPGEDHVVFEIEYSHPSYVDGYKVYNHDTDSYFNETQVHVVNDNILAVDGLQGGTEYTVSIDAITTTPDGESSTVRVNSDPITFTTILDDEYNDPVVLSYEIVPTNKEKTAYDVTLIYYYPDETDQFTVTPSISAGTIELKSKSQSGPITTLEYEANITGGSAEISWSSQETLDYTKPFSYYADDPSDFYDTIINPAHLTNQYISGDFVAVYKSPNDGKYYPLADLPGVHELRSAESGAPENYYMDENGNINPDFIKSGNGYEGFCGTGYSSASSDAKNGVIMAFSKLCPEDDPAYNTAEGVGFKNGSDQFFRAGVNDQVFVQITGWEEVGNSGNYGFTYQFVLNSTGEVINVNEDMTIKYDSAKPPLEEISFWRNTPANGSTIFNTEYLIIPMDGNEAYFSPLEVPKATINTPGAKAIYPYANRSGIEVNVGLDTTVNQYHFYINEGENNTNLTTATLFYSTSDDNLITAFADTEYNKDYTIFVTAETDTVSDTLIASVNTNEWENAMRHQTYYSNQYGGITYILLDDGTIMCSNLDLQMIIDDMQADGVRFSSVNGMIVTQDGTKYNPFTMLPAPDGYARYMEQSFVKKEDGMYVWDPNSGTDSNNWYSTSTDLTKLLNDNANNGMEITQIATSHIDSSATKYDYDNIPENINYLGSPVPTVTNGTAVMDTSNGAPDYGGGLFYTYTLIEGQPIKEAMDPGEGGARYAITPDDNLVTTWKNPTSIPTWLPVSNIHSICQGGSQFGQLISIQTKDGTIYNWNYLTGEPTRLNGINIHTGEVNTFKSSVHANHSQNQMKRDTRQFYRDVSKGDVDLSVEADPYGVVETYETQYAYMQMLPGRLSVDEVLSENGLNKAVYNEHVDYNNMVNSLVEDMAISQSEAEKIVNDYVYATNGAVPLTSDGSIENDVENSVAYLESNNYISEEEANKALNNEESEESVDTSFNSSTTTISQVEGAGKNVNFVLGITVFIVMISSFIIIKRK